MPKIKIQSLSSVKYLKTIQVRVRFAYQELCTTEKVKRNFTSQHQSRNVMFTRIDSIFYATVYVSLSTPLHLSGGR